MRLFRTLTAAALSVALILAGRPPATGQPDAPGGASSPHSPPGAQHTVTLVTDDVVHLSALPDGRPVVTVDSRDAGPRRGYRTYLRDGEVHVIPMDASHNVTDDADHACREGTSLQLAEQLAGDHAFIDASLGELLRTGQPLSRDPGKAVIFSPFGLGILGLARLVVDEAVPQGRGLRVDGFLPDESVLSGVR